MVEPFVFYLKDKKLTLVSLGETNDKFVGWKIEKEWLTFQVRCFQTIGEPIHDKVSIFGFD